MAYAFKRARLICILVLLVGLMTVSVTAAQAETGAYWEIGLSKEIKGSTPEFNSKIEGSNVVLLTKVGVSKVEIVCTTIKTWAINSLEKFGSWTGQVHYEGCITKVNGATSGPCKPHSPGALEGLVETNTLDGLIVLHETGAGSKVDLFELLGFAGAPLVTVRLGNEFESECAIGEKINVTGKVFLKDAQEKGLTNQKEHLVVEGPLSKLFFGSNAATIDGSALVFLRGEYEGFNWSGHPA